MNNQSVSARQVGILASILLLTLKFTNLASLLFEANGLGGIISILIVILSNLLFIGLLIWLKYKFKNMSLYDILKRNIGTFLTKFIYCIFFLFFMFKILSLMSDGFSFIRDVADEEFTKYMFLICFLPLTCAFAKSGIRNIGRTAEFFFPYIFIGLIISIMFSFVPVNLWGIGSLAGSSLNGLVRSLTEFSFYNGDLFALLIFLDKIDINFEEIRRIFIPFLLISVLLFSTYIVYYSLYQQTSTFHTNLIYDIVQYAIGISSGWHMDLFSIIVYSICLFLQGGIFLYCAQDCTKKIFNYQNDSLILTGLIEILILGEYVLLDDLFEYVNYARTFLSWFSCMVILLIPLVLFIIVLIRTIKDKKFKQKYRRLKNERC